jgi:hypothetical protein
VGTRIVLYSNVPKRMKITGIGVPYIKQCRTVRANLVREVLGKSLSRKARYPMRATEWIYALRSPYSR